ncbi:MAG: hypothetical protein Tsb0021_10060 [Chlamydiales bacterium]
MNIKTWRRSFLRKLGYIKISSPYQIPHAFEAQKKLIKSLNPVIFDVGTHIGETVASYYKMFPKSTIHCFEPFPASFESLRLRFHQETNIHLNSCALSDECGVASFNVNSGKATNSLLDASKNCEKWVPPGLMLLEEKIQVSSFTLDAYVEKNQISRIDILKMDTQGSELKVLRGARELLTKKKIQVIYTEICFVPLYEQQGSFHEISAFLFPLGYQLYDIYNRRYSKNGQVKWADVIYVQSA